MKIVDRKKKVRLSRKMFVDLCVMVFRDGRFVTEDVDTVKGILSGDILYDAGVQGRMVPNAEAVNDVSVEVLHGIEQAMSYFCDKYGVVKGFIIGELFFRKQGDPAELLTYADALERMFTRVARTRASFYRWFVDVCLKERAS